MTLNERTRFFPSDSEGKSNNSVFGTGGYFDPLMLSGLISFAEFKSNLIFVVSESLYVIGLF